MLISVIVSTYNRPDALSEVLRALMDQTDQNYEVIVADDGSSESTREIVNAVQKSASAKRVRRLVHAWHPDQGFRLSAARNMAITVSNGEYLIFLDGDCIPRPGFVQRHRLIAERGFMVSGSRVLLSAALTKRTLSPSRQPPLHRRGWLFWTLQRLLGNANKILPLIYLPDNPLRHYREIRWHRIKGCNLAFWKNDLVSANGFDESFTGWGHEDADLVLRLARLGVRRKGGAFSTEVFHLWHKENARTTESENRERVEDRMKSGIIEAPIGLRNHPRPEEKIQ
jgi:glycosyltransferase involved in cell wall biosynthesis